MAKNIREIITKGIMAGKLFLTEDNLDSVFVTEQGAIVIEESDECWGDLNVIFDENVELTFTVNDGRITIKGTDEDGDTRELILFVYERMTSIDSLYNL